MSPVRTNNDVEGWHNRLNSNVVTQGSVPAFLPPGDRTACKINRHPHTIKLVSEGRLKHCPRKWSRQIQGQVFGLWKQYFRREITASQLLRECAFVYGPPAQ